MTDDPVHFVFDLDDTLYAEEDYVRSALTFVGCLVGMLFGVADSVDRLLAHRAAGVVNPMQKIWDEYGLPPEALAETVAAMRAHVPDIQLRPDAAAFLQWLRDEGADYAIVTDGRSVTQRAKISALGCLDARCISISEEVGLSKMDTARFIAVERQLGSGRYIYVGDNPAKDFVAPNRLGWLTAMLSHDGAGVHGQDFPDDPTCHPQVIIVSFADLLQLVAANGE